MDTEKLVAAALVKAFSYFNAGDFLNAEELYRQILRVDSDNIEALEIGGIVLSNNGHHSEGREWLNRAIGLGSRAYNNLGLICGAMNDHLAAIANFRLAIAANPTQHFSYTNLAIELKKLGDYPQAFSILDSIENPNEHVYFNYGALLHEIGQLERAVNFYEKAIEICYEFPSCHYNLSACLFLLGDYSRGWKEYEWRWKQFKQFAKIRDRFTEPYWSGEDLSGKTIVLYTEQGVGDTIMMCRFIAELKGRVILECIPELHDLMSPLVEVCCQYTGKLDYHCSLLSLPGILGSKISPCSGYLKSTLEDSVWDYSGLKVGICWTGNPRHPNDRNRSCPLKNFQLPGTLFSFQKDIRPHAYPDVIDYAADGPKLIDLREHMHDFNCTAKLLEKMDLIVTVDTCIAHLAGAIGKKVFLLLPFVPDWRWGTSWYEDMHFFKQKVAGRWDDVFEEIRGKFPPDQS